MDWVSLQADERDALWTEGRTVPSRRRSMASMLHSELQVMHDDFMKFSDGKNHMPLEGIKMLLEDQLQQPIKMVTALGIVWP